MYMRASVVVIMLLPCSAYITALMVRFFSQLHFRRIG